MYAITIIVALVAFLSTASQAFTVTGATGGIHTRTGARPFRQDILKMQRTGGAAWDLYLQALQKFQAMDQKDELSWFQMNGIHGFPAVDWDGIKSTTNPQTAGYAPHNSILFGPWHRVYLAAYEHIIQQLAREIAGEYPRPTRTRYQNAAETLRVPYWGWASSPTMPPIVVQTKVSVRTPKGTIDIDNPLATYKFHPVPDAAQFPQSFPLSQAPSTRRSPDASGNDQVDAINRALKANAESLVDKVYFLIARQQDYAPFSNTGFPAEQRNGSYDSLESIHNQIHGLIGGSGHMAYVPFSSFDPMFWLHHCNIDRLFAIWSAINPDSYISSQLNRIGTYAEPAGTVENANTPLYPWKKDDEGNFHTAATARDMKSFGYSYPEVVDWGVSPQKLASNARRAFKKLYNPTGALDTQHTRRSMRIMRRAGNSTLQNEQRDWFVNVQIQRKFDHPIAINFFLGQPPTDMHEWATASNLITSQMVLPDLTMSKVAPPFLAQIPLTRSLALAKEQGELNATDVDTVNAFLHSRLQWTVSTATGDKIEPSKLTDLQITIVDQTVKNTGSADQFNQYGALENHTLLSWKSNKGRRVELSG